MPAESRRALGLSVRLPLRAELHRAYDVGVERALVLLEVERDALIGDTPQQRQEQKADRQ